MPIKPKNHTITIPSKVADTIWITSLNIMAPTPAQPIRINMLMCPMVSATGELIKDMQKSVMINNLEEEAKTTPEIATAMGAIFAAVQKIIDKRNLF